MDLTCGKIHLAYIIPVSNSIRTTLAATLVFICSLAVVRAGQTASIITSDPIHFVKGTGSVTRPVQPDEIFRVITTAGDEVTIADSQGFQATLNRASLKLTDILPPAPPATNAPPATALTSPPTPSPSPPTNSDAGAASPLSTTATNTSPSPEDADLLKQLNDAFQAPIFATTNLWTEDVATVASRLQWPQESKTPTDSSYRKYALGESNVSILGARAYSMALYARNGRPTYISIVFANKGDFAEMHAIDEKRLKNIIVSDDEMNKAMDDLNAAVKTDSNTINAQLTAVLGTPESHVFGPTADSRVNVHRWDWKGHTILFSSPQDQYAAIKIVPTEVADHFGDVDNMDRETIKAALANRVLKSANGDVTIQEIPMVDQGPKGYCVPATWERYLRYVDVPADMYVLAMLGNSGMGGGTSLAAIRAGVDSYVESYGRRIETADVPLDVDHVSKFIDQGLPLMWGCFVTKDVEKSINHHSAQRRTVTDWDTYKQSLVTDDKALPPIDPEEARLNGHMRMIIGYNPQTDELAISDSWGENFAERWITVTEAQSTSNNDLEYVQW
jgi:hypothetical protein